MPAVIVAAVGLPRQALAVVLPARPPIGAVAVLVAPLQPAATLTATENRAPV
ncbi:MAG TPA: hypothetical protein VFK14_12505 [Solirubrobacterales bacterium]|nr:hypothetical protein [Solirubrobacterales bacterium]